MGCTSSTEAVRDPVTGQTKVKHTFGGAPPGLRRPQNDYDLSGQPVEVPVVPIIPVVPTSTKPPEPDIPVATPATSGGLFDTLNANIQSKGKS